VLHDITILSQAIEITYFDSDMSISTNAIVYFEGRR